MRALLLTFALLTLSVPSGAAGAVPAEPDRPRPVTTYEFADPAVTTFAGGYVGFATGSLVPRATTSRPAGEWRPAGVGLVRLPSWAHADGDIWASEVARAGRWWLLYFAAPVRGIGEYGRCIGVARSRSPLRGFVALGGRPLVCPKYAKAPTAYDVVPQPDTSLPRAGVIDPSTYAEKGQRYLLYKTDRIPSSIRIVALSDSGIRTAGASVELFRHDGVLENPVVVKRDGGYTMLLSQGDFGRCSYRTIWRRSTSLLDWTVFTQGTLTDRASTGLCGPGGADVSTAPRGSRLRVFLHAWTCARRACPAKVDLAKGRRRLGSMRPMYAADLAWRDGVPMVTNWQQ